MAKNYKAPKVVSKKLPAPLFVVRTSADEYQQAFPQGLHMLKLFRAKAIAIIIPD